MVSRISQSNSSSISQCKSQSVIVAETAKKMHLFSFAKISAFLWRKSWAYSVFLFPFFILFYKWPSGRGEASNCLHTMQSYMEVLQLNKQFVLFAAKRKEPEQVVFHFVSREAKSQSLWPLAF